MALFDVLREVQIYTFIEFSKIQEHVVFHRAEIPEQKELKHERFPT